MVDHANALLKFCVVDYGLIVFQERFDERRVRQENREESNSWLWLFSNLLRSYNCAIVQSHTFTVNEHFEVHFRVAAELSSFLRHKFTAAECRHP